MAISLLLPMSLKSNSLPLIISSSSITSNTHSTTFLSRVSFQSSKTSRIRCQAQNSLDSTVYKGIYGPWSVDSTDVREVILYRSGLVTAAATFVIGGSTAFLPDDFFLTNALKQNLDVFYALGAGGLGLSLFLIHIYVTEIKRTLQALWAIGVLGSVAASLRLAQPVGESLPQYVADHSIAVWFIGPLFAALTGLVFKEGKTLTMIVERKCVKMYGLCYGKLEAGILTFIIPSVLLGHLTGLMDDGLKLSLLGIWMVLFSIFAARKFTQPIKDDIGDKSVFIFNALPEKEKKDLLEKLGQADLMQDID
ncbi:hypothetical protein C5167_006789 [Papaver somniferum]|uniref:Uncharacterized protein n=1 Tax=Papaver somniferum TaxID=3469 RepID=A0A4Y7JIJ7_PAPSO|nr:hypothetical protein C5167_006789 [Papaver somniferum]